MTIINKSNDKEPIRFKHRCPKCNSKNIVFHSESTYSGTVLRYFVSCDDCHYESDKWREWVKDVPIIPNKYCIISEGLLEDIRDVLLQSNQTKLVKKINEVLK